MKPRYAYESFSFRYAYFYNVTLLKHLNYGGKSITRFLFPISKGKL